LPGINASGDAKSNMASPLALINTGERIAALPATISLRGRHLEGAVLIGAHLRKADFTGAYLQGAVLYAADLRGATFGCAHNGRVMQCADIQGARLDYAQLQGAFLDDAQLRGASLDNAELQGLRRIGCAAGGAPYVIRGLLGNEFYKRFTSDRAQAAVVAQAFLDEAHCPGARGLSEQDKAALQEIHDSYASAKP
jgi:uncharacterized protein YjbI with pentapeptide repeats